MAIRATILCVILLIPASLAGAGAREDTLAILDGIAGSATPGLEVWVNSPTRREIRVGERMAFHFRGESEGYLTVLYLDSHGVATLIYPVADAEAARIRAGRPKRFPPLGAGFELEAKLPHGPETVFAFGTPEPISLEALGVDATGGDVAVVEAEEAPELARKLAQITKVIPSGSVTASRFDHTLVLPVSRGEPQYTSSEIVGYFTARRRSIRRPKLDLNIKFALASAELSDSAKRDLDEVGRALLDPQLNEKSFVLGGHTDDTGTKEFNQALSMSRAQAARSYLVDKFGVEPQRLDAVGHGELRPMVLGTSAESRAQNRRVVLEMIR